MHEYNITSYSVSIRVRERERERGLARRHPNQFPTM